ncbi:Proline iminopeptidase [Candidatus Phaeomarinobacter ectocarpi]|uniref:Proline iminopeptidase n=2 Tax=Candidatus Phaeomarinibacter ectocarpi TaxID=1458461 RepID=X5MFA3_9HYPH|nr:Proline iminopeptidase [Candidatus Phaeomarinobacter ectocarpi]
MYLHGGPGSGFSTDITQLTDPEHYRIILADQRGAGRSRPHGSLEANTTPHLIQDIERLRNHLKLERWALFGGSWGATLAVVAAMAHPKRVARIVLYGLFLSRQSELEALYYPGGVAAALYPDVFADFLEPLTPTQQQDPITAYAGLFADTNNAKRLDALHRWTALEKAVSRLVVDTTRMSAELADPDFVLAHSLIENHYFRHHGFIDGDSIIRQAATTLADIKIDLVTSRYDIVCPPQTAFEFARAVPHTNLTVVPDAGHTWRDPSNTQALLTALNPHLLKDTT